MRKKCRLNNAGYDWNLMKLPECIPWILRTTSCLHRILLVVCAYVRSDCITTQFKQSDFRTDECCNQGKAALLVLSTGPCCSQLVALSLMRSAIRWTIVHNNCLGLMLDFSSQGLQDLAGVPFQLFICQFLMRCMHSCHISACPYVALDLCSWVDNAARRELASKGIYRQAERWQLCQNVSWFIDVVLAVQLLICVSLGTQTGNGHKAQQFTKILSIRFMRDCNSWLNSASRVTLYCLRHSSSWSLLVQTCKTEYYSWCTIGNIQRQIHSFKLVWSLTSLSCHTQSMPLSRSGQSACPSQSPCVCTMPHKTAWRHGRWKCMLIKSSVLCYRSNPVSCCRW